MKQIRLKSAAFIGAILFAFCRPLGGLKTVAAPHAGMYECTNLTLDGRDFLCHFDCVQIELKGDGEGTLHCRDKTGGAKELPLRYEREENAKEMVFIYSLHDRELRVSASYEKGEIVFTRQSDNRLIIAIFSKK